MGVEIKDSPVSADAIDEMERFVGDYLEASVESDDDGGRMRWYPWHSATYRFTHTRNVAELAAYIAEREAADVDVVRVAALFHDVAKLEAEQDRHAEEGARVAREYLTAHADVPPSFVEAVCTCIREHSYQGSLDDVSLETRCLIEADVLDKVGANGLVLLLLRTGYEARPHTNAAEMAGRVLERGRDALDRVESDTAESVARRRLKRVRWFREWFVDEVAGVESPADG